MEDIIIGILILPLCLASLMLVGIMLSLLKSMYKDEVFTFRSRNNWDEYSKFHALTGCSAGINNGHGDISYHDWNIKYSKEKQCYCGGRKLRNTVKNICLHSVHY